VGEEVSEKGHNQNHPVAKTPLKKRRQSSLTGGQDDRAGWGTLGQVPWREENIEGGAIPTKWEKNLPRNIRKNMLDTCRGGKNTLHKKDLYQKGDILEEREIVAGGRGGTRVALTG